jgi:hypothetical protein
MSPSLPYVPPSKGLLRSLQADVQALAHERLAQHLRWYQKHHQLTDEQVAQQMNACPAVIGIRARTDDAVFAPISEAKIARFKDGVTRPQRQTLDQMTAFFAERLGASPFLYWADMDDVLTAFHDARRFRKDRMPKSLIAATKGWINTVLGEPTCALFLQLSPLTEAPVILVRGRMTTYTTLLRVDDHPDIFLHGYGTLTADNLNLYVRDAQGRQIVVYMDVVAGPLEDDPTRTPFLFIKQITLSLPPAFDHAKGHPYRLRSQAKAPDPNARPEKTRPGAPIRPDLAYIDGFHLNEKNTGRPDYDQVLSDEVFAMQPGKTWTAVLAEKPKQKTKL